MQSKPNPTYEESVNDAYTLISHAIATSLTNLGYRLVESEHCDADFGSRYIVWVGESDAIRFIWDGKDGMFALEHANSLPLFENTVWLNLVVVDYNPNLYDSTYITTITEKLVGSLPKL